jgi:hypothetical protein
MKRINLLTPIISNRIILGVGAKRLNSLKSFETQWVKHFNNCTNLDQKIKLILDYDGKIMESEIKKLFSETKLTKDNIDKFYSITYVNINISELFEKSYLSYIQNLESNKSNMEMINKTFSKYVRQPYLSYHKESRNIVKLIIKKTHEAGINPNIYIDQYSNYFDCVEIFNELNLTMDNNSLKKLFKKEEEKMSYNQMMKDYYRYKATI